MDNSQYTQENLRLPVIPLRGVVIFPSTVASIDVARDRSLNALKLAAEKEGRIFLVTQKDAKVEHPGQEDLYAMGTVARIRQMISLPDQSMRVLLEGIERGQLLTLYDADMVQQADVAQLDSEVDSATNEQKAMMETARTLAEQILKLRNLSQPEFLQTLEGEQNPGNFCDVTAAGILKRAESRQPLLECTNVNDRLELLLRTLADELEIGTLEDRISQRVREYMDRANHEYYLREQIHAIQDELGEDEDEEVQLLRKRLNDSLMPKEARDCVEKELRRMARASLQAPESSISQNYIEFMLNLPWGIYDKSEIDIKKARRILEEDHYGMKEVKERLIEYLAVRKVTDKLKSPILCLVGPPGVGKTSVARSVARALDRKFVRMSLGGVHDEAEIRGHRKTYVGAMPGRIISSINRAHTMNPVFLLDEVDKLAHDMRGDPASALLEVLDPAQNQFFRDHYLETPFDLSEVLFITTANSTDSIDQALLDRMEIIEVPSYTLEEKVQIARRHLIPKQLESHGLKRSQLRISEKVIGRVIDGYTRESGVRSLERTIAKLCRKVTLRFVENPELSFLTIKQSNLTEYLGTPDYLPKQPEEGASVGLVNGLAWTRVGGEVMPVEAIALPGKGILELTGNLGDVMKESAHLAKSLVRARLKDYGIEPDFLENNDIHIHVPEGATPKDGPSAGVALTCALMSAVTGIPANSRMAMTGEITLHGKVLPIGGVKEKLLAAYRLGIPEILLPVENEKDLDEIDGNIRERFEIHLISTVDEALGFVLVKEGKNMRLAI